MEFHEKLQQLRKQKGLTQEQLAEHLYVSRAAISKWESGRGYPNIDSLKAIAAFYSITIDELLSGDEVLTLAQADQQQKSRQMRNCFFGLLDLCCVIFLFLPLFGQQEAGMVRSVSLLSFCQTAAYLKAAYWAVVSSQIVWGLLVLVLPRRIGEKQTVIVSVLLQIAAVLLFMLSSRPYPAVLSFLFLMVKGFLLIKKP